MNYRYGVPGLSRYVNNAVVRAVFDNWQISGVTSALRGGRLRSGIRLRGSQSDPRAEIANGVDARVDIMSTRTCRVATVRRYRAFATDASGRSRGQEPHRQRARGRNHWARLSELGPHLREVRPVRPRPSGEVPRRSCATRSTTCSSAPSIPRRLSTPPVSRPTRVRPLHRGPRRTAHTADASGGLLG